MNLTPATPRWYSSRNAGSGHPSSAMAMTTQVDDNSIRSRQTSVLAHDCSQQTASASNASRALYTCFRVAHRILGMHLNTKTGKHPVSCQHRKAQEQKYAMYLSASMKLKLRPHGLLRTKSCQICARQKSPESRGRVDERGCIRSVCRITATMRGSTAQICGAETQKSSPMEVVGRTIQERSATSGLR